MIDEYQLHLGDCLEVMKSIPDKSVDCVITDPPYGMNYVSSWRKRKHEAISGDVDVLEWLEPFCAECYRVMEENTHIYAFCNDYAISDFYNALKKTGFTMKRALVFLKNNHTSGDLEGDYGNMTEFIVYAHKGRRHLNGKRGTNVLKTRRALSNIHPTEKPVDLMQYIVEKSTEKDETILDPFMGSGTTGVACLQTGRKFIGIEKEPKYFKIAKNRIETCQLPLL